MLMHAANAQTCASSATTDTVPANPGVNIPIFSPPDVKIRAGQSELVTVLTMGGFDASAAAPARTNCPHTVAGIVNMANIAADASVTVPTGAPVLLRACALPANNGVITRITVPSGATLVLDDQVSVECDY